MKINITTILLVSALTLTGAFATESSRDLRPLNWLKQYEGMGGNAPLVQKWRESALHPQRSNGREAWCGAAMAAAVSQFGYQPPRHPAGARNWLNFGVPTTDPQPGDIVIFWRKSKESWEGHVAMLVSRTDTGIMVLGGNQGDKVSIISRSTIRVLGYRRLPKGK